jgi:hypothetical protein
LESRFLPVISEEEDQQVTRQFETLARSVDALLTAAKYYFFRPFSCIRQGNSR